MIRVVYTNLARRDALEIIELVANEAGKAAAAAYAQKFENTFDRLAVHPEAYPLRESFGAGIRAVTVRPYLILYRYDQPAETVTVLRLVHGRRYITSEFMKMR